MQRRGPEVRTEKRVRTFNSAHYDTLRRLGLVLTVSQEEFQAALGERAMTSIVNLLKACRNDQAMERLQEEISGRPGQLGSVCHIEKPTRARAVGPRLLAGCI